MKAGVRKNDDFFSIVSDDTLNAPYLPNAKAYELQTW